MPFEVPRGAELAARLPSVLEVVYLVFNEGYAATPRRRLDAPELCEDALRLGRILAELVPERGGGPRARRADGAAGVAAARARRPGGEPILLLDQDRSRWDQLLVASRPRRAGPRRGARRPLGPVHAAGRDRRLSRPRARPADETDWPRIVALYDALVELTHSPVVELNRAVAVAMAFGPAAGLELVDALVDEPALARVPPAAERARRPAREARPRRRGARASSSARRAQAQNSRERALLLARAKACQRTAGRS